MAKEYSISIEQIAKRTNDKSFKRGEEYFRKQAISNTVQRGNTLEALCEGSYEDHYQVSAVLDKNGVKSTLCTCEYDWGGDCKHIVALLLTYVQNPASFVERSTTAKILAPLEKPALINIIQQMLDHAPELQFIVDSFAAGENATGFDAEPYHAELRRAFTGTIDWKHRQAHKLTRKLLGLAMDYKKQGEFEKAVTLCCAILDEFSDARSYWPAGDDASLSTEIYDVAEALGLLVLDVAEITPLRQQAFRSLIKIYFMDIWLGGMDIDGDSLETISTFAKADDLPLIRQYIETERQTMRNGDWENESIGYLDETIDQLEKRLNP